MEYLKKGRKCRKSLRAVLGATAWLSDLTCSSCLTATYQRPQQDYSTKDSSCPGARNARTELAY